MEFYGVLLTFQYSVTSNVLVVPICITNFFHDSYFMVIEHTPFANKNTLAPQDKSWFRNLTRSFQSISAKQLGFGRILFVVAESWDWFGISNKYQVS